MTQKSEVDKTLIYGASALYASILVQILHPFDVIKTRLQSHDGLSKGNIVPKYGGIGGAIQGIFREEGLRGFTKGIFVSLAANGTSRILFFALYHHSLNNSYENRKDSLMKSYGKRQSVLLASLQSGFFVSLITQPIWVMYTRVQLNTKNQISGLQNFKENSQQIFNQYGVRGFYRGFWLSLMLCLHGIIQINTYELLMNQVKEHRKKEVKFMDPFVCGLMSKAAAIYITYPLSTIRTRFQQNQFLDNKLTPKYTSVMNVVSEVFAKESVFGFYKGIYASLMKGMPSKGLYFLFYEQMKTYLQKKQPAD